MALIIAICILLLLGILVEVIQRREAKKRKALYERALAASKRAKALQASRLREVMLLQEEDAENMRRETDNE